jgi:hypothetical protein
MMTDRPSSSPPLGAAAASAPSMLIAMAMLFDQTVKAQTSPSTDDRKCHRVVGALSKDQNRFAGVLSLDPFHEGGMAFQIGLRRQERGETGTGAHVADSILIVRGGGSLEHVFSESPVQQGGGGRVPWALCQSPQPSDVNGKPERAASLAFS